MEGSHLVPDFTGPFWRRGNLGFEHTVRAWLDLRVQNMGSCFAGALLDQLWPCSPVNHQNLQLITEKTMTMRTYRYFVCPNNHRGEELTSENDQPYSKCWESVSTEGLRDGPDGTYLCATCGLLMSPATKPKV